MVLGKFSWQKAEERALVKVTPLAARVDADLLRRFRLSLSIYSGSEYAYYSALVSAFTVLADRHLRPRFHVEVVAPASAKQILRARPSPGVLVRETAAVYEDAVEPHIAALDPKSIAWIHNVLDLSKEKERMLYNDPDPDSGFLLAVSPHWTSHPDLNVPAEERAAWHGHDDGKRRGM